MWLEIWGKTPMDLGVPPGQLDPWWEPAILLIKTGHAAERSMTRR